MSMQVQPKPGMSVPTRIGSVTWNQAIWGLGIWLALFAIGSLFVSNPFWMEKSAAVDPNYAHVMYLHGLLVGLAALIVLVACEVFKLHSNGVRVFSLASALLSTLIVSLGGIFDATLQVHWVWLILHVIGFFLLDAVFIAMLVGFFLELKYPSETTHSMPFWLAIIAGFSLEFAALMGHLAGWILSFGDHPALLGAWASLVGEKLGDFDANLITSHSHEIVVAVLALLVAVVAQRFGYLSLQAGAKALAQVGGWFVMAGTVLMTVIYVVGGITAAEPPALFTFGPGGVNGLAGDDLVTGVGVMIGGLLLMLGLILNKSDKGNSLESPSSRYTLVAVAWSWLLLVATVVLAGYYIEFNEVYFGVGDPHAPGAAADAVFTFAHQDFAFYMLPALMAILLITNLVLHNKEKTIAWGAISGSLITFIGVLAYVFADPKPLYSVGYVISAIGVAVMFVTLLVFLQGLWKVIAKEA
ncbi:hypothetical protein D2Q93_11165 [Alicyclobacillaceae bacterium I2511]|nr:hypothetical protein D2Q93_11165 [Alicyclobacillaceae bacterium I2511]